VTPATPVSGTGITGGGSGYIAILAHVGRVLYGTELGSVTLKINNQQRVCHYLSLGIAVASAQGGGGKQVRQSDCKEAMHMREHTSTCLGGLHMLGVWV
jgi:hypothetical protein